MIQRKVPAELEEIKKNQQLADSLRAIDGARTRGLDLGKVANGEGVWYDGEDLRAGLRPGYVDGNPAVV